MSKTVENIYRIKNNPFVLTEILIEFYKSLESEPKNALLMYLVFPIVLFKDSNQALTNKNSLRTIRSFKKESHRLYGLAERINEYKELTNVCLQFAIDQGELLIEDDMSVYAVEDINNNEEKSVYKKAAHNLAVMLSGEDVVAIYRQFGIKKI